MHQLKFKLTLCIILTLSQFNTWSQSQSIWVTIPKIDLLEINSKDSKISSANNQIQSIIDHLKIQSIHQALPSSRKPVLLAVYEIKCDCDEHDLLQAVSKQPSFFIHPEIGPNYEILYEPNDYSLLFDEDYALNLIHAEDAWDITHGDSSIILAISDQNFFSTHEELIGKWVCYDSTNLNPQTHGTAVAITAAGSTNNALGKSSIGFNSKLALYQMSYNDILTAAYSGSRVINTSWTSGCLPNSYIQAVMDEAYEHGAIIVCAAGNGGTCGGPSNLVYPAACDHVISVTSIGPADNHERTLNDPSTTHQHNATVDISSPGYDIALSTSPGSYSLGSGTSFATPLVTGTIGLMLAVDSCLTFEDVETILYATAVNIDSLNPDYAGLLGHGRLNAGAALLMARDFNACGILPVVDSSIFVFAENQFDKQISPSQNSPSVGMADIQLNTLQFYPNPVFSNGILNINTPMIIQSVEIVDLTGKIVQIQYQQCTKIELQNLNKGIYIVQLSFENGTKQTKKLMIK